MSNGASLEELIDSLQAIPRASFSDDLVLDVVRRTRVDRADLEPFVDWRPDRYTRHLVYRDDLFQIIVLCWNVGQRTPIHDHAGQKCWMMIEQGRLEIEDYRYKEGVPPRRLCSEIVGGDDLHIDQCACVHKIVNRAEWGEPALSVHVYSRPFDSCYVYDLATGERELIDLCYDSVGPLVEGVSPRTPADGPCA